MTNSESHAKRELEILAKTSPDALIIPFTNEILALCEAFGKSGQSGGSAPYTASAISEAIKKLMMFETITPLTGENEEWVNTDTNNGNGPIFQNKRDSRVFKDGKEGKPYFIDAVVFDGNISQKFTTNGLVLPNNDKIGSTQYIKKFPFVPKTFYIEILEQRWKDEEGAIPDINGEWWTYSIKDTEQLKEVFEYYEKFHS